MKSMSMKTIHSPEGVSLQMENLWLRHKAGIKQLRIMSILSSCPRHRRMNWPKPGTAKENCRPDDEPEELFGAWI